jgi:hypothetical protein
MAIIYQQPWATTFGFSDYEYQRTDHGGSDAALTGYAFLSAGLALKCVTLGTAELDLTHCPTCYYQDAGVVELDIGDLTAAGNGDKYIDLSEELTVTVEDYVFDSDSGPGGDPGNFFYYPLVLVNGGNGTAWGRGLFEAQIGVALYMDRSTGLNFEWRLGYNILPAEFVDIVIGTDALDNLPHTLTLVTKAGTISGTPGSYSAASDGYIKFYIDDVLFHEELNIPFVPGYYFNDTAGGPTAIWGYWLGYSGLPGQVGTVTFSRADVEPDTIPINESVPCCASSDTPPPLGSGSGGGTIGGGEGVGVVVQDPGTGAAMPAYQYEPLQPWTRACATNGTVPSAPDEVDSESWA